MAKLIPHKFNAGDSIKVIGLDTDSGKLGVIIKVDAPRHFYTVRLQNGVTRDIYEANLGTR